MENSIKKNIFSGLVWKLLERFGVLGTQFVVQVILARLLSPEYYGTLSIMMIFITLSNVFVQNGFNTALIQNKNIQEEDYSSVFWISLLISFFIYLLIFIFAPMISNFYNIPDIIFPLRVLSLMIFPGALNSIQLAKLSRQMEFKKIFISNFISVLISGFMGVFIAFIGGGIWALVIQNLLNTILICIVMKYSSKLKIKMVLNINRVKILFDYGSKLLLSSLIDTLYQDFSSLVIGKKFSNSMLGFHNQGKQFPQFIISGINGAIQSVMLPAMSIKQDDKNQVKSLMRNSITLTMYIVFPLMVGLAVVAKPLVSLLLTDKWLFCVPFIQIYCFSYAFYPVHSCNLQAINAIGRSDIFLKLEIIKKCFGISALLIAIIFFDSPLSIAMTSLFTTFTSFFINAYPNKKLIDYSYFEQIKDILPNMLLSFCMGIPVYLITFFIKNMFVLLLVQVLVGFLLYVCLSYLTKNKSFNYLLNMILCAIKH